MVEEKGLDRACPLGTLSISFSTGPPGGLSNCLRKLKEHEYRVEELVDEVPEFLSNIFSKAESIH